MAKTKFDVTKKKKFSPGFAKKPEGVKKRERGPIVQRKSRFGEGDDNPKTRASWKQHKPWKGKEKDPEEVAREGEQVEEEKPRFQRKRTDKKPGTWKKRQRENRQQQEEEETGEGPRRFERKSPRKFESAEEREKRRAEELPCTLFLRNVPMSATEEDVSERFKEFGPLRYAKLVVDRDSGISKGSAFVCFENVEDAEKCLADAYPEYWHGSSSDESCITIAGRQLSVSRALSRDDAERISSRTQSEKRKEERPHDKRNLRLAEVGYLSKEEMEKLKYSPFDISRRLAAREEKLEKLKDPNFLVSETRLSLRFIPMELSDTALKAAARAAGSIGGKFALVKQAKIVVDKVRVDPTGKPRSRGLAFVEFATHEQALAALNVMNGKVGMFGGKYRPLVEFAVENSFALEKLKRSIEMGKEAGEKSAMPEAKRQKTEIPKWKLDPKRREKETKRAEVLAKRKARKQMQREKSERLKARKERKKSRREERKKQKLSGEPAPAASSTTQAAEEDD